MHAERVNGYDPIPVIDAFRRKKQILLDGRGPVLLETVTYRISGHSPSDASSYRSKEETELWQRADSIPAFRHALVEHRVLTEDALDSAKAEIEATIVEADAVVKGQTASSSYKPAKLDNGVRVMVPPHIAAGTRIVVDVYSREYVKRAD